MSQFDFPRINCHGKAFLDTPTANNGYIPFITMFDQSESGVFVPPRIYFDDQHQPPQGFPILKDNNNVPYVPIPITLDDFQQWATTPLGSYPADAGYLDYYKTLGNYNMNPGYWNYYGDLSIATKDVFVTGLTINNADNKPVTYTKDNIADCTDPIASLFGAEFSFNDDYFSPKARTTAYMCDVDSEGQLCTQIFCSQAGLYLANNNSNTTFFKGRPVKSTVHFMNINRVLNYAEKIPMGGSATFYSMLEVDSDSEIMQLIKPHVKGEVGGLFIKLMIHEVFEVRNPDYSTMPVKQINTVRGNKIPVPKNPAKVSITGSITPWFSGDMKTNSISRIMKNAAADIYNIDFSNNKIDPAYPIPKGSPALGIPTSVNLGPVPFVVQPFLSLLTLDLSNMLTEYGADPGEIPSFAGATDIPPFETFHTYDYGQLDIYFQPDSGGTPVLMGSVTHGDNYSMDRFLENAGMIDLPLTAINYMQGYFYMQTGTKRLLTENDLYILTDQQGMYAEQNQQQANLYMVDGLPLVPCTIRAFNRGVPISALEPVTITVQGANMSTGNVTNYPNTQIYDGLQYTFPVDTEGCTTYVFPTNTDENFPTAPGTAPFVYFAMNAPIFVCRVLSAEPELEPYLSGQQPVTWEVIFNYVLQLYKTVYPIMDAELPIEESVWNDAFIQSKISELTNLNNWNEPMFMPLTRDMSATQRQLLQMWIAQSQQINNQF